MKASVASKKPSRPSSKRPNTSKRPVSAGPHSGQGMKLLSLCGSLRKESSNHALLKALQSLSPAHFEWVHFEIKDLPYFDPHLQFSETIPGVVKSLREAARNSDFIIVSTPEYAHGIPGVLKNALEWLICEETMQKKVVILVASPSGGKYVTEYLTETLRTMDLLPEPARTLIVRDPRHQLAPDGRILDGDLSAELAKFASATFGAVDP